MRLGDGGCCMTRFANPAASPAPHPSQGRDGPSFQSGMGGPGGDDGGQGGRICVPADPEKDRACAFLPLTDLGNAERWRMRNGETFRFCDKLGWFMWDARRWKLLSEEKDKLPAEVLMAIYETVRAIRNEAELVRASGIKEDPQPEWDAAQVKAHEAQQRSRLDFVVKRTKDRIILYSDTIEMHAKSSEGASRLGCIANLAKAFADIAITEEAMDADPFAINVLNGTLKLQRRNVKRKDRKPSESEWRSIWDIKRFDHDRADLISKLAPVEYRQRAKCPEFDRFLAVVQPKADNRRFLQQWHGYSMTGDVTEHALVFHHGKGRNGKSTLVDLIAWMMGGYSMSIGIETFMVTGTGKKGGEATPDIARLPGVRFLRTSEPEKGSKLNEALIKLATGGEEMTARHLNRGFFDFYPQFKMSASGNHKPKITGHDDGIWARVKLVPWVVQIAKGDIDRDLPKKLRAEASGVLNWLIEGMLDWRREGLIEPQDVIEATAKYREASDQLGRFLQDCTVDAAGKRVKSSTLFALFTAWAKATGGGEWTTQGFAKAMEDRGYERITSNGVHWLDIEATVDEADLQAGNFGPTEPGKLPPQDGNDVEGW